MKFRKKPVVIEAIQFNGTTLSLERILKWMGNAASIRNDIAAGFDPPSFSDRGKIAIRTLEGTMFASPGDWIIKGVKGEFYPCKPDIFAETYDEASEEEGTELDQLITEAQQTAERLNKLNAFMATDAFPNLKRAEKDLLYSQQRIMSKYVQTLGKRIELAGSTFSHKTHQK